MFIPANGFPYRRFFRRLHKKHVFDWYLEIGCREGQILAEVQGKTIGVDPNFIISSDVISRKPGLFLFQDESDGFFEKK